ACLARWTTYHQRGAIRRSFPARSGPAAPCSSHLRISCRFSAATPACQPRRTERVHRLSAASIAVGTPAARDRCRGVLVTPRPTAEVTMKRAQRIPPRWFVPVILIGGTIAGAVIAGLVAALQ